MDQRDALVAQRRRLETVAGPRALGVTAAGGSVMGGRWLMGGQSVMRRQSVMTGQGWISECRQLVMTGQGWISERRQLAMTGQERAGPESTRRDLTSEGGPSER